MGQPLAAGLAWEQLGLTPLELLPKESLALMNGTSFMTGLACIVQQRAERLARWCARLTAMVSEAVRGNPGHFNAMLARLKPHPGQIQASTWILDDLGPGALERPALRLQDRYSLRCAPQVLGALLDSLSFSRRLIHTELNSVSDNPLIDPDSGEVLHGGNFYGGHICLAMDSVKAQLANAMDLVDRQLLLLCDGGTSGGLPDNLVGISGAEAATHHGFKAMQITAAALAAEANKLTMPASVFSRSTESHNQDKVSLGNIAVRDCRQILQLGETAAAIATLGACQALELRGGPEAPATKGMFAAVRSRVEPLKGDRRQDADIAIVLELYRSDALPLDD